MSGPTANIIPAFILKPKGLEPAPYKVGSLTAAIAHEPQGVYTVARTFHGDHALLLDAHLDRLEQSARLSRIPLQLDRDRLRAALRELLYDANYPDAKFRITVPQNRPDWIYLALEPYQPVPEAVQRSGAHTITVPLVRQNPVVKTTTWMIERSPAYDSLPPGVYEGILMREDGALLEGLSTNFYGVIDGVLYTSQDGVLEGITRHAILEIVPQIMPVKLAAINIREISHLSEAMLTSSSRGVVPATRIDDQPVNGGTVGPVVADIRRRYNEWTEANIAPL